MGASRLENTETFQSSGVVDGPCEWTGGGGYAKAIGTFDLISGRTKYIDR